MSSTSTPVSAADLARLSEHDRIALDKMLEWRATARDNQLAPQGNWSLWGVIAGRGWGKTKVGAEWVWEQCWLRPGIIAHVVAPTASDVSGVCFDGPSGLVSVIPPELIVDYNKTDQIINLTNGSKIRGFSAEKPARLRGPQCHIMWADELAAWQRADETWDMAMFGLRLGDHTRALFTTTPRPIPLVRSLMSNPKAVITRGTTYENKANLSANFYEDIITKYEGTQLGRQELNAELIDPEETGIIKRSWIRLWPKEKPLPNFEFIVVSLDTAFTEKTRDAKTGETDPTACTVWGLFRYEDEGGIRRDGLLLLDCWDEHLGMPGLLKKIPKEMDVAYGEQEHAIIRPSFGPTYVGGRGRKPDLLLIEEKGSGISLIQMLAQEGIHAVAYNPGRASKLERLHGVAHLFANGLVWMVESDKHPGRPKTWAEPLIAQLCAFSGEGSVKHDDYVDSTSQALRLLVDQARVSVRKPRTPEAPPVYEKPLVNPYG